MSEDGTGQGVDPGNPQPGGEQTDGQDQPFYGSFQDVDLKAWAENKHWTSPEAMAKSAYNLEKHLGVPADRIARIPVEGDAQGMQELRQRLGAPTEASGYEFEVGEEVSEQAWAEHMRGAFLKAGLAPDQATLMVEASKDFAQTWEEREAKEYEAQISTEDQALRKEWGQGYEDQMALASAAARNLGLGEDAIDGLEASLGYAETIKLIAKLGAKMGEDNFSPAPGGAGTGFNGGRMTPEQAKASWNEFTLDSTNMKALLDRDHPGHKAALERKSQLFSLMYPE